MQCKNSDIICVIYWLAQYRRIMTSSGAMYYVSNRDTPRAFQPWSQLVLKPVSTRRAELWQMQRRAAWQVSPRWSWWLMFAALAELLSLYCLWFSRCCCFSLQNVLLCIKSGKDALCKPAVGFHREVWTFHFQAKKRNTIDCGMENIPKCLILPLMLLYCWQVKSKLSKLLPRKKANIVYLSLWLLPQLPLIRVLDVREKNSGLQVRLTLRLVNHPYMLWWQKEHKK